MSAESAMGFEFDPKQIATPKQKVATTTVLQIPQG